MLANKAAQRASATGGGADRPVVQMGIRHEYFVDRYRVKGLFGVMCVCVCVRFLCVLKVVVMRVLLVREPHFTSPV